MIHSTSSKNECISDHAIPIIIGVSGHRDLDKSGISSYRIEIRSIFEYFINTYPSTPIMVLTALAEGADRIVAEEAINMRDEGKSSISVVAPLPFAQDMYEQDFVDINDKDSSDKSISDFRKLVESVDECFSIDQYRWPGFNEDNLNKEPGSSSEPERAAQYANVGAYIARYSNILIALWDGSFIPDKAGGTGHVVQMMLNGDMFWGKGVPDRQEFKRRLLVNGGEHGVVIHIPVERESKHVGSNSIDMGDQGQPDGGLFSNRPKVKYIHRFFKKYYSALPWNANWDINNVSWYYTGMFNLENADHKDSLEKIIHFQKIEFVETLRKIDQFNTDSGNIAECEINSFSDGLCEGGSDGGIKLSGAEREIQYLRVGAANLANHYKKPMKFMVTLTFIMVTLMAVGYDSFKGDQSIYSNVSLIAFLIGAGGIGLVLAVSYIRKYKRKQHDYRALAEMLRVMLYLVYCRMNHSVNEFYGADTRKKTSWIEHVRRYVEMKTWMSEKEIVPKDILLRLQDLNKCWIEKQRIYLSKKIYGSKDKRGLSHYVASFKWIAYGIYAFSMIILFSMSWIYFSYSPSWIGKYWPVVGALFAMLGLLSQWHGVHGYDEDLGRYKNTLDMFCRAEIELSYRLNEGNIEEARLVVQETAIQALDENAKWYLSHAEKDIIQY